MALSQNDVDRIAERVVELQQNYSIESKEHYDAHQRIDRLLQIYDQAQNIAWRTFLSLLIIGGIVIVAVGAGVGKFFKGR